MPDCTNSLSRLAEIEMGTQQCSGVLAEEEESITARIW